MILIIDLSKKQVELVLKEGNRNIASHKWAGLYNLSETFNSRN